MSRAQPGRVRAPFAYRGGKARLAPRIVAIMPPHRCYVEPFGGAGSVLLAKPPSSVEVYNDADERLVTMFRVLADAAQFMEFARRVLLLPYSRAVREACAARLKGGHCEGDVDTAVCTYIAFAQGFGGTTSGWGIGRRDSKARSYVNKLGRLPAIHARPQQVHLDCRDAVDVIGQWDGPETLHYCDPPYAPDARRSGGYRCEMGEADHKRLVEALLAADGRVMLSGYRTPLYAPLEAAGWHVTSWHARLGLSGNTRRTRAPSARQCAREECLWTNYDPDAAAEEDP